MQTVMFTYYDSTCIEHLIYHDLICKEQSIYYDSLYRTGAMKTETAE